MRLFPAVLVLPSLMLAGCVATGPYYPQEVGRVYGYDSYSTYDPYPPTYYGPDVYYYSYRPAPDYYYRPGYGYYRPQAYGVRPSRPPDRDYGHNDHGGHDHGGPRPPRPGTGPDRPDRPDRPTTGLWGSTRPDPPPQAQPPSRPERPDRKPGLWGAQRPDAAPSRPSRPPVESAPPPRLERPQANGPGRSEGERRRGWGRAGG